MYQKNRKRRRTRREMKRRRKKTTMTTTTMMMTKIWRVRAKTVNQKYMIKKMTMYSIYNTN